MQIGSIVAFLKKSAAVGEKIQIPRAYSRARDTLPDDIAIGDDCAAIRDGHGGYILFAGEAMLAGFVADDPWFAGYSAVMVNISDICAMGGKPTAIVDMVWSPDFERSEPVWDGMCAASKAYAVPIVGGHTTITKDEAEPVYLAAAILGHAKTLMTSFDAKPGFEILMAVDLQGNYRGDQPFWNTSVGASPGRLQTLIGLLPQVAERGWATAAKDISNGGVIGTLIMLLQSSGAGARLNLGAIPRPDGVDLAKWLVSFPSFGYLFAVAPESRTPIQSLFSNHGIECEVVGRITDQDELVLALDNQTSVFWTNQARG